MNKDELIRRICYQLEEIGILENVCTCGDKITYQINEQSSEKCYDLFMSNNTKDMSLEEFSMFLEKII